MILRNKYIYIKVKILVTCKQWEIRESVPEYNIKTKKFPFNLFYVEFRLFNPIMSN